MQVVLRTTKDTPIETRWFMLDLPPVQTRHKMEHVKAYFSAIKIPTNPLHKAVKDTKGCRLGESWMGQASATGSKYAKMTKLKQTKEWERYPNQFQCVYKTLLPEYLGKHCQEWPAGRTEIKLLIQKNSKPQDFIVYTDSSVAKVWSGWGFTVLFI